MVVTQTRSAIRAPCGTQTGRPGSEPPRGCPVGGPPAALVQPRNLGIHDRADHESLGRAATVRVTVRRLAAACRVAALPRLSSSGPQGSVAKLICIGTSSRSRGAGPPTARSALGAGGPR